MQFIYGFILGSGFLWGLMTSISHAKERGKDFKNLEALLRQNEKANEINMRRADQQNRIADLLEQIEHNMTSGYAKCQST